MEMLLKQTTLVLLSVCVAATTQCTAVLNETRTRVVVPVDSALTLCYRMKSWTPKRFEINADIPTLMSEDCNGTEVLVHVSLQDTWWLWVTVAVFGLIVLVLLVLCLLLTRQRKRREQSCPVYMNTHPSPRAPSTAQLRAPQSSQKLRTPSPARDNNNSKQRPKQQQRCHK
ncbi:uncharacterized protein LOC129188622 isoform X6 [Dunckerocampus dactyliophorus]|uniref:uncharacterized protein LOC129188622 isoform X6 n=1 Tax=Dunckerocampus dactyliophorus TaxID=161453 RepID=UPI002404C77C|nr:uncharacterized protein LOC129188622 isoform X6 [Dunckerocampus dactyliophorus]